MAYKFTCPNCDRDGYSAAGHEDQEWIRCIYCAKKYRNPYYREKRDDNGKA